MSASVLYEDMQVSPATFYAFNVIAVICMLGIVAIAAYFFLNTDVDKTAANTARQTEVAQLQTRASTYFARLQYYDGVCASIGATGMHPCYETERAFATGLLLTDGTFYCTDSTGYRGPAQPLSEGETACTHQ